MRVKHQFEEKFSQKEFQGISGNVQSPFFLILICRFHLYSNFISRSSYFNSSSKLIPFLMWTHSCYSPQVWNHIKEDLALMLIEW